VTTKKGRQKLRASCCTSGGGLFRLALALRLNLQINCVKGLRGTLDVLDVLTDCCSGTQMAGTCTERNELDARRRPSAGRNVLSRLHSATLVLCWSLHRYGDL